MRAAPKYLLPTLAASLTLAACGSSTYSSPGSATSAASSSPPSSSAASSAATTVKTASNATLGATVLTDAHGMTIYRLSGEQAGRFICTNAACLQAWHPVRPAAAGASASGSVGSLASVKRPDGTAQLTYTGMPLYTFAGDRQPGDAKGQGFKDVGTWNAVTVSSTGTGAGTGAATTTKTAPAQEPMPSKSGGY